MAEPLTLLSVHAHPDDEASKGATTVARYHAEGVHTVLVTCTGGEEGEILNPAMDRPEVHENLASVRRDELDAAAAIIGYDEVVMLGYRDSGMPDSLANADPNSFASADLDEAVGRLVAIIRRTRPQVILTYGEDQRGYPHPDHLRVHEISVVAFDAAGDADRYPDLGEPFAPSKLYYSTRLREQFMARHEKFLELGLESPYAERIESGWVDSMPESNPTTFIAVGEFGPIRQKALLAHATQVDPTSGFWFGLPEDAERSIFTQEAYELGKTRVSSEIPESDLFAGIRSTANASR